MYATMIACAFASCSKDEDPIVNPDGGDPEANATLEVQISNPSSKALPSGANEAALKASEDKINSLQLLVFNGTGDDAVLEVVGTTTGLAPADDTKGQQSVKTPVKPGNKIVVVLANVEDHATYFTPTTTTFSQFKAAKHAFEGEKDGGLTMNSKMYYVEVKANNINYMGYGRTIPSTSPVGQEAVVVSGATEVIKLYRNVAKVVLNKIDFAVKVGEQYPQAKLATKKVFILHAHKNTHLVGAAGANWGATDVVDNYLNGYDDVTYAAWVKYMVDGRYTQVYNYIPTNADSKYAEDLVYSHVIAKDFGQGGVSTFTFGGLNPFYVYENAESAAVSNYRTLLVVEADFSYKGVDASGQLNTEYTTITRYYPIAVGYDGVTESDFTTAGRTETEGLFRNLQYNVNLKITGPGYETPFGPKPDDPTGGDTFLDSKVEVVPFGAINQDGEIE